MIVEKIKKHMIHYLILIIFLLSLCYLPSVWAGEPGTTGANFLKIGMGARAIAMGEAYTAVSNDIYSIYWNPAGLVELEDPEVTFMYNKHFQDIVQQIGGYAQPLYMWKKSKHSRIGRKIGAIGCFFNYVGIQDIQGYDADGISSGDVKTYDYAGIVSYARKIKVHNKKRNILSMGSNVKFITEKLDKESATSYAIDVGAKYKMKLIRKERESDFLSFGIGVYNVGSKVKFVKEKKDLPRSIRAGVAYINKAYGGPLTVAVDGNMPNDNDFYFSIGTEYWIKNILGLRVGYKSQEDAGIGLRTGIGIKINIFSIDYAFVPYGDLGNSHIINLNIRFRTSESQSSANRTIP